LLGLKRSGGKEGFLEYDTDLGARHAELLRIANDCVDVHKLHRAFLTANKETLAFFKSVDIPWYVPKAYGGLGLTNPDGGMSYVDRVICTAMILGWFPGAPKPTILKEQSLIRVHFWTQKLLTASGIDMEGSWTLDTATPDNLELSPMYLWLLLQAPELSVGQVEADMMRELIQKNTEVWRWYQHQLVNRKKSGAHASERLKTSLGLPVPFDEILPRKFIHSTAILYGRG
jgi:hypothetical protein